MLGVVLAVFAGAICAVNMVPYLHWTSLNGSTNVHLFTLSQAVGAFLMAAVLTCGYAVLSWL